MNPEPNEAVYWRQVADSRLATIYQERDAKQRLQARLDALDAEHTKLVQDFEELHAEHQEADRRRVQAEKAHQFARAEIGLLEADRDHWRRQAADATADARRRQERAERYAQAYYERRQDPEEPRVDCHTVVEFLPDPS